jgi:hypothetical protein
MVHTERKRSNVIVHWEIECFNWLLIEEITKLITATSDLNVDSGRKHVGVVQMASMPLFTLVQYKPTILLLFSLARQS